MSVALRRRFLSIVAASLPLLAAATAAAEAPMRPFGSRGQFLIEDLVGVRSSGVGYLGVLNSASSSFGPVAPPAFSGLVGYDSSKMELPPLGKSTISISTVSVAPSFDVFVANRFSLGLTTGFAYGWGRTQPAEQGISGERGTSFTFGVAPRIGYVIPLGAGFSIWPRLGVGYTISGAQTENVRPGEAPRQTSHNLGSRWTFGVDAGVVYRPTRNLFFSATPELSMAYSSHGMEVEGETAYIVRGMRVRFAGTLSLGVLLGG